MEDGAKCRADAMQKLLDPLISRGRHGTSSKVGDETTTDRRLHISMVYICCRPDPDTLHQPLPNQQICVLVWVRVSRENHNLSWKRCASQWGFSNNFSFSCEFRYLVGTTTLQDIKVLGTPLSSKSHGWRPKCSSRKHRSASKRQCPSCRCEKKGVSHLFVSHSSKFTHHQWSVVFQILWFTMVAISVARYMLWRMYKHS
jgi:hypothetical protein